VYKDSVADAISNQWTTVTNDLKKVVMSKWEGHILWTTTSVRQSFSYYILFQSS
jgi:hypothetical protein